jgi:hypothetical protein
VVGNAGKPKFNRNENAIDTITTGGNEIMMSKIQILVTLRFKIFNIKEKNDELLNNENNLINFKLFMV